LHLKKALTKDPTHGPCWTAYAVVEERSGNAPAARRILEQGMRSAPHHGPLYRTYAEMEAKRGRYDAARALYQKGIAADPFYAQLFHSYVHRVSLARPLASAALLGAGAVLSIPLSPHLQRLASVQRTTS
jgi:Tfp pilus assembly protein PilF